MAKTINLVAMGQPQALRRAKACVRGGHAAVYDPKKNVDAKEALLLQVRDKAPKTIPTGAVALSMEFHMARPKGHYGTGKNAGKLKDWAEDMMHTSKPDLDNLIKLVKDALNKVFWKDDAQVTLLEAEKMYSESPRTEIAVYYEDDE